MRRTAAEAAHTRVKLLQAALLTFQEQGWRGATFSRVAERAGLTRGAVHHHFPSKAVLLTEALEWGWSTYGDRLFTHEAAPCTAEEWMRALLGKYVALLQSDAQFCALAATTVLVTPHALEDSSRKHEALDNWRDQIAASLHERTDLSLPAETVAGLVLVLLQGFTVTAVIRPDDLPQPEHLDAAIAALVSGLLA